MSSNDHEIRNPFPYPRHPYFLPGYTGFCPRQAWMFGKTYGRITNKVMTEQPELGQTEKFPPTSWKETKGTRAEVVEKMAKEGPCVGAMLLPVMYTDHYDINRKKRDVDTSLKIRKPYIGGRLNPIPWRDPDLEAKRQVENKINEMLDEKADRDRENALYHHYYPKPPPGIGVYSGHVPPNLRKPRTLPRFDKLERKTVGDARLEVMYGDQLTYNTPQRSKYAFAMEPKKLHGVDPGTASYQPRAQVELYDVKSCRPVVERPMPRC